MTLFALRACSLSKNEYGTTNHEKNLIFVLLLVHETRNRLSETQYWMLQEHQLPRTPWQTCSIWTLDHQSQHTPLHPFLPANLPTTTDLIIAQTCLTCRQTCLGQAAMSLEAWGVWVAWVAWVACSSNRHSTSNKLQHRQGTILLEIWGAWVGSANLHSSSSPLSQLSRLQRMTFWVSFRHLVL